MDINVNIKPNLRIRAFYLFFIITGLQTGVGIMGVPRYIFEKSHQDAWISILIAFVFMAAVVYVMFIILDQYENADIFGIQVDVFGKWIGKLFGLIYIVFFMASLVIVLLTYIEVLQIFLYPTLHSFIIGLLLIGLSVYCVFGGIRVVVGVVFLFFLLTQWLMPLLYDPISRMDWDHFLPMFQASIPQLLQGAKQTTFSVIGFEILFVIYPFIANKEKARLSAILGIGYTTFTILLVTVITIGYFSPQDLGDVDWSVLTLFKSVSFTFIERLDYLVVAGWMMIIIPNIVILMWGISYGTKRLFRVPQKISIYAVSTVSLIAVSVIKNVKTISLITDNTAKFGFWLIFIYPLVLLPLVLLKKKRRLRKGRAAT